MLELVYSSFILVCDCLLLDVTGTGFLVGQIFTCLGSGYRRLGSLSCTSKLLLRNRKVPHVLFVLPSQAPTWTKRRSKALSLGWRSGEKATSMRIVPDEGCSLTSSLMNYEHVNTTNISCIPPIISIRLISVGNPILYTVTIWICPVLMDNHSLSGEYRDTQLIRQGRSWNIYIWFMHYDKAYWGWNPSVDR